MEWFIILFGTIINLKLLFRIYDKPYRSLL
ncbi:MAG: hypothetical protein JWQ54_755 [Mucilaginibacter sp.]|nr:hypothetical protein [Mucilaginibacter sp.]